MPKARVRKVARCSFAVHLFGYDHRVHCVRDVGHGDFHTDGLWWFDEAGLRVPREVPAPRRLSVRGVGHAGWKERVGVPRGSVA